MACSTSEQDELNLDLNEQEQTTWPTQVTYCVLQ